MRPDQASERDRKDTSPAGKPANGEPGIWLTIEAVPESADSPPPDPESFTIPTDDPDYDYDLFSVRPRPDEIPFGEPEWTIVWE